FRPQPGGAVEVPEAGDFEKDEGFSFGAWVKFPRLNQVGAVFARMDNPHGYRGWDLWFENGRLATHILHHRPDDPLKVVARRPVKAGQWHHVLVTYDGSGKAAGVKFYLDGVPQATDVQADKLRHTIRTDVPFKLGQRHTAERLEQVVLQDVRLYGAA